MTKELEAFVNEVKREQSDYEKMSKHDKRRWPLESSISRITFKYLYTIERVLTPPTADEVCKAIEEWYQGVNTKIFYEDKVFKDIGYPSNIVELCRFSNVCGGVISFGDNVLLPPHLITLIGRFYESLEVEK